MNKNSRVITTNQKGMHEDLPEILDKNLNSIYRKPIQKHNKLVFDDFLSAIHLGEKIILDSCCGTGLSTYTLSQHYPDSWVVGIDQSQHRLDRALAKSENMLLLRTNCEDFWRLCRRQNVRFQKHFILFPNPYPKKNQIKRRWYAHPVFRELIDLSDEIEVRSNWDLYIKEFQFAWQALGGSEGTVDCYQPESYLTLFEKKYHQSGQQLYRYRAGKSFNHR